MKTKQVLMFAVLFIILGVSVFSFLSRNNFPKTTDNYLPDKKTVIVENRPFNLTLDDTNLFKKTVQNLNEGWENIRVGNSLRREGNYEEALKAYKRTFEIDPGNRLVAGRLIAETYEAMGQYDDAIFTIDEILKTQPLGEYGIEKYSSIRTRLLAAKAQAAQSVQTQS